MLPDSYREVKCGDPIFPLDCGEFRYGDVVLRFVRTSHTSKKRIGSFAVKEPTTLFWMDHFTEKDILYDVGANVGTYSVYAAKRRRCHVYCFEPEALNYAELNKNLFVNGLRNQVAAFCIGLSNEWGLDALFVSRMIPGYSHHDAGENLFRGPVTKLVAKPEDRLPQGCVLMMLDDLYREHELPFPTHIKIDVDGLECKVIQGAVRTLQDPRLQTVLIETDFHLPESHDLMKQMENYGFQSSLEQMCTNRSGMIKKEEALLQMANNKFGANVIWFRDPVWKERFAAFASRWPGEAALKSEILKRGLPV